MRALVYETVTGKPVMDAEVSSWDYSTGILAPDHLSVGIEMGSRWARGLDLRDLFVKDKRSVALIDESVEGVPVVVAAGPVVLPKPLEGKGGRHRLDVKCQGIERMLEWRQVRSFPGWPLLNAAGLPTGVHDQRFGDVSYGTILKHLVLESMKWPGGGLPIRFEDDRPGVHVRTAYLAVDGKQVLDAMDDIADLNDGVEYDFRPSIDERDWISFDLVTGTDAGRIVAGPHRRVWNIGGSASDVVGLEIKPSPAPFITDAVFAGGKGGTGSPDSTMLAIAADHSRLAEGFPRFERWDSSHSSVSVQATLQAWAEGGLGGVPDEVSFKVRASEMFGVRHGDLGVLSARDHWWYPDEDYAVRVLSLARSSDSADLVSVSLV